MSTQEKQSISGFEPYVEKKGEEYMGEPMRLHFTKILNKWKQDLMQEVDRTVDHMKDEAANFPDPADRASQEEVRILRRRDWYSSPGSPPDRGPLCRLQDLGRNQGKTGRQVIPAELKEWGVRTPHFCVWRLPIFQ
jgi:hypothetical protein